MSKKAEYRDMEYIRTKVIDSDVEDTIKAVVALSDNIEGKLKFDGKITPVVVLNTAPLSIPYEIISIAASGHWHFTFSGLVQIAISAADTIRIFDTIGATEYNIAYFEHDIAHTPNMTLPCIFYAQITVTTIENLSGAAGAEVLIRKVTTT